jgi:hypothetical protein
MIDGAIGWVVSTLRMSCVSSRCVLERGAVGLGDVEFLAVA